MIKLIKKVVLFLIIIFILDYIISEFLKNGMRKYNQLDKKAEILCIGHSHTENGIDEKKLEKVLGLKVAKYFMPGANNPERLVMLQNYFKEQAHIPKIIIYDVDARTFEKVKLSDNFYLQFYPYIDTFQVDHYVSENGATQEELFIRRYFRLLRYNDSLLLRCAIKGYFDPSVSVSTDLIDLKDFNVKLKNKKYSGFHADVNSVKAFEEILNLIRIRGSILVLLFIPTLDVYNKSQIESQIESEKMFRMYSHKFRNVIYLNYNDKYEHNHKLFLDAAHVNKSGQEMVTNDLISDINIILKY